MSAAFDERQGRGGILRQQPLVAKADQLERLKPDRLRCCIMVCWMWLSLKSLADEKSIGLVPAKHKCSVGKMMLRG